MAIKTKNKIGVSFNTSSMSDLVFLLLIFFMLTSTLVAPNAIKLLLPSSSSQTSATQDVTVSINEQHQFFVNESETPVSLEELPAIINGIIDGQDEATVVVRSHKDAPVQDLVTVIDIVKKINDNNTPHTKHKVILATSPESNKQ